MMVKRFHQLVHLQRGPVHTAILDFLKGALFLVKNDWIDSFTRADDGRKGISRDKVAQELAAEELLIEVPEDAWIPSPDLDPADPSDIQIVLEIEDGTDIGLVNEKFQGIPVAQVNDYRTRGADECITVAPWVKKEKDYANCLRQATVTGTFCHFQERSFGFNRVLNPCWGKKIAVTADNHVRPCIMSEWDVGGLRETDLSIIFKELEVFWGITKDRIEKCRDCELRYICFDCREIAWRKSHNLFSSNPLCQYDPHTGTWLDE